MRNFHFKIYASKISPMTIRWFREKFLNSCTESDVIHQEAHHYAKFSVLYKKQQYLKQVRYHFYIRTKIYQAVSRSTSFPTKTSLHFHLFKL